jgi:amidase
MTEAYLGNVDLYNEFNAYLANHTYSPVCTLQDIIDFNNDSTGSEGGIPNTHPAFPSGQDGFLAAQATLGIMNETYQAALEYVQYTSGPMGIDAILNPTINGTTIALDGYLVPSDDSAPGF